jgi:hypothetical protein
MAIRRKDFDDLQVASRWKETVVDDISLSQIAVRRRRKSVLVTPCVTYSDDLVPTLGECIAWFSRQILYVKAYLPGLWLGIIPVAVSGSLVYALLPLSIVGALFTQVSFWEWGGGASLLILAGEMLAALLYALLHPIPRLPRFVILAPLVRVGQLVSYLKTISTRTITWSGVRYRFDKSGKVILIER